MFKFAQANRYRQYGPHRDFRWRSGDTPSFALQSKCAPNARSTFAPITFLYVLGFDYCGLRKLFLTSHH